jgi:hypothetical protein
VFEQPFASVKVKVTVPAETPVTVLPLTVALAGALLTQVPPVAGVRVRVAPTHTDVAVDGVTTGLAFTVTADVVFVHPVPVCVNVNVALPALTPVTTPAFVTVAIEVLLLNHVPPEVGDNVMVEPAHIEVAGEVTTGRELTVTEEVVELQPVVLLVNVKVTEPAATPVTVLPLTVAFVGSLLTQVPPVAGVNVIVLPTHTADADVFTVGGVAAVTTALPFIVMVHPLLVFVATTV